MAADKFNREDALHLMQHFDKWVAQKYGQPSNRCLAIGGVGLDWRVDSGRDRDYTQNWGVSLQISAPNKRTQRKLQRSLKAMQKRVEENVAGAVTDMAARERGLFDRAEASFQLGWCAMRMKRKLQSGKNSWDTAVEVRGTIRGGKQGWIKNVKYHAGLDTLIVPSLNLNGTDYFIPLEQSDVVWATVMTEFEGVALTGG